MAQEWRWRSLGYSSQQLCLSVEVVTCTVVSNLCLHFSSGVKSLEEVCLQVTDLLPGLKKLRNLLPEHGCLLLSPGNFWQNDRERFNADPDIIKTIHQHEPKTLQTSATLKGKRLKCQRSPLSVGVKITGKSSKSFCSSYLYVCSSLFPSCHCLLYSKTVSLSQTNKHSSCSLLCFCCRLPAYTPRWHWLSWKYFCFLN